VCHDVPLKTAPLAQLLVNNTNDKVSNLASVPLCQALFFSQKKKNYPRIPLMYGTV